MRPKARAILLTSLATLAVAACARNPEPAPAPPPDPARRYESLPDTVVCVVDRTTSRGLRGLSAKKEADGRVVLLVGGQVQPLEEIHPVSLIAGYSGQETWFSADDPITLNGQRFTKVESERRIPMEVLGRLGEFRGIPLFSDPNDTPPPEAVYVPVRPGCIFQAYVREDLLRRPRGGA